MKKDPSKTVVDWTEDTYETRLIKCLIFLKLTGFISEDDFIKLTNDVKMWINIFQK